MTHETKSAPHPAPGAPHPAPGAPHVVLGAGQVGTKLAELLLAAGYPVRLVRRGPAGPARPGLEWLSGDLREPAFADRACAGAATVYNCVNPADYGRWEGVMEPLHEAVQDAAVRAGVPLVGLDCLYMVGVPETSPFDETVPMRPIREKGEMRARLVRRALRLRDAGELRVTFGRAADFFGPDTPQSLFGDRLTSRLRAGKGAEVLGDPDLPRSYSFTPDVARGLMLLGTDPRGFDHPVWHLPVVRTETTRELVAAFAAELGAEPKVTILPQWLLRLAGLFSPTIRQVRLMSYQWAVPYALDDSLFRETFGVEATPVAAAVRATLGAPAPALLPAVA